MQLNLVIVTEDKDGKHLAYPVKETTNRNFAHYCESHEGYGVHVVVMQIADTYKMAQHIADVWNADYKRNGTLMYQ